MDWTKIYALMETQHGLVTRGQLLESGATDSGMRWAITSGRLTRKRMGVYALAGSEATQHQAMMAATLAAGPSAAASHLAAAWLWDAEPVAQGPVELTTFDGHTHRLDGVITHRSTLDGERGIKQRDNIPTVAAPLTIVQLADTRTPLFVGRVANDLVKKHFTNFREILYWVDKVGGGRHVELRAMCQRALEVGGHDDSPAARRLGEAMIEAGVEPFETDYTVSTPEGELLVDFAWPEPKVGLEYKGFRDHATRHGFDNDARRLCRLNAMGWRILEDTSGITHAEIIRWVRLTLAAAQSSQSAHAVER